MQGEGSHISLGLAVITRRHVATSAQTIPRKDDVDYWHEFCSDELNTDSFLPNQIRKEPSEVRNQVLYPHQTKVSTVLSAVRDKAHLWVKKHYGMITQEQ